MSVEIRLDDLSGEAVRALIAAHLEGMHDSSPPESVHALDIDALRHPSVTLWSAWVGARQQTGVWGGAPQGHSSSRASGH